ncbi:MAG: DUF2505 domain-containing protein [Mycobacteriaceae bacterium]|nr:DUF2505 domain-containing protein [Mycobacterium sp.]NBP85405.1 DUF2505 domain-containing protein [Mycobacteriaceae bacterium]NBQ42651.1 DUF2505 domain-containing protein [Mycobacteriaceae bacterium]
MPRSMVYTVDIDAPASQVYQDFTTVNYWEDLIDFYQRNSTRTEIVRFESHENGTEVAFAHIMTPEDLPAIARPVVPAVLTITREQHFDLFQPEADQAVGHYRATTSAVPFEITGEYLLRGAGPRSQMRIDTHCSVKVPIIGGQIEKLIINGLSTLFANEGEFTAEWVAGHR